MADAANKLYRIFRAKPVNNSSKIIGFTVIALNPMMLSNGDKLIIPRDFFIFNNTIDTSKISIGDKFLTISVNDGQLYYVQDIISSKYRLYKYEAEITSLQNEIVILRSKVSSLEDRVSALERRYN